MMRLLTFLAICLCLMIGCGQGPAKVEVGNDAPKPAEVTKKPLPKDFESLPKDFESLKALAEKGDAGAQIKLGWRHWEGAGVLEDFKEAVKWFRKAAEQRDARAQGILGLAYSGGEGVLEDYVTAYAWVNIAAANGNEGAKKTKGFVAEDMTPDQIAKAEALAKEMIAKNPKLIQKKE